MSMITSVLIYQYRLPLTYPITWGNRTHKYREGLLICLRTSEKEGWGEIAPLPKFSQESLSEALTQTSSLAKKILNSPVNSLSFTSNNLYPSVQFGFELAKYSLTKDSEIKTVHPPVACCKLLIPQNQNNTKSSLQVQGFQAVKLKVGKGKLDDDLKFVHTVWNENPRIEVRIDANRAWSLRTALDFLSETKNLDLGYIEEPLRDKDKLSEFTRHSHTPLALDETLREPGAEKFKPFADVYVLKPTLSGGIMKTIKEMQLAEINKTRCIISSSYESGVGILGLMELAMNAPKEIHGLDTYKALERDVLIDPLPQSVPNLQPRGYVIQRNHLELEAMKLLRSYSIGNQPKG